MIVSLILKILLHVLLIFFKILKDIKLFDLVIFSVTDIMGPPESLMKILNPLTGKKCIM